MFSLMPGIKRKMYWTIFPFFIFCLTPWNAYAANQPKIFLPIKTCVDLQNIKNDLTNNYELLADIDCSGVQFEPIGTSDNNFTGTLEGNGHKIKNLYISSTDPNKAIGLFAYTNQAIINNLIFDHSKIVGICDVGTLVGYAKNTSIDHVKIEQGSTVALPSANQTADSMGGLAGLMDNSHISNSSSSASVQGGNGGRNLGGLVGVMLYSTIENSYTTGSVQGGTSQFTSSGEIAGLVGFFAGGKIQNSYSAADVITSNAHYVGGLIGTYQFGDGITNSYATGTITGGCGTGGLIGRLLESPVNHCYATGKVNGQCNSTNDYRGGLIGSSSNGGATVTDSYWDIQTSGQSTSTGGIGKTTAEMHQQSTYINWDFTNIWNINEGSSYPWLRNSNNSQ